jgi:hypothetical protein
MGNLNLGKKKTRCKCTMATRSRNRHKVTAIGHDVVFVRIWIHHTPYLSVGRNFTLLVRFVLWTHEITHNCCEQIWFSLAGLVRTVGRMLSCWRRAESTHFVTISWFVMFLWSWFVVFTWNMLRKPASLRQANRNFDDRFSISVATWPDGVGPNGKMHDRPITNFGVYIFVFPEFFLRKNEFQTVSPLIFFFFFLWTYFQEALLARWRLFPHRSMQPN